MKEITEKQIEHLTALSSLAFSKQEIEKMKSDLEQILTFVDQIESCDASNQNIKITGVSLNDLREDKPAQGLNQSEALSNAPKQENGAYVVSKVVD